MWNIIIKLAIIVAGGGVGWFFNPSGLDQVSSALIGIALSLVLVVGLTFFEKSTPGMIVGGIAGFLVSAFLAVVLNSLVFGGMDPANAGEFSFIAYVLTTAICVSGTYFGIVKGRWLTPVNIRSALSAERERKSFKILDTSVIIDGRVADICEAGFLDGALVVPQFVLKELQQIADSSQSIKRNRGRRGLEILQKVQKMSHVQVIIAEKDFPEIPEVDLKLIELARSIGGKIVTNDFNLNKVAQLRGVSVLNINELANALKPVVLPGEIMQVFILKEGKEANQGIGYLDDGTMVVVDNSSHMIGTNIELVVTSVLQTTAGKMIFGKTDEGKANHLASMENQPESNTTRKSTRRT